MVWFDNKMFNVLNLIIGKQSAVIHVAAILGIQQLIY